MDDQDDKLKRWRAEEAEDLTQMLAEKYKLPYLDLSKITIEIDAIKIVPQKEAEEARLATFQSTGKKLQVAIQSPNPNATKGILKELEEKGYKTTVYLVSENSLKRAWSRYKEVPEFEEITRGAIEVSEKKLEELIKEASNLEKIKSMIKNIIDLKKTHQISELVEIIIAGGIGASASDIHIEPEEKTTRLRFRLDGVLQDIINFDTKIYKLILSRIKLVSGLKLNIKNKAQDGRFSIHIKDSDMEIRTSVIPSAYGESIVLRILDPKSIQVEFESLGIENHLMNILKKEISKPNGMILTTGPTGSGKTTTLYAFLRKINTPETKIITIEDPIEYHLEGVTQTQVDTNKGYTFASGLRSILRQDPDVIMVGEIRDIDTAKIALNAALTGHLVFSTLHTNNAAGTIPRLIDLGINPASIAPALNASMAQRLVRKLCDGCKSKKTPTVEEKDIISAITNSFPKRIAKPNIENLILWSAKGCEKCNNTGYKGRIGIYETILINEEIEKIIFQNPSETDIKKIAANQEILNMVQDGVLKVLTGVTSLEELGRVVELKT